MAYAVTADVAARLPGRTIDTTSSPTAAVVLAWTVDAQAELDGALAAAGMTVPVTSTRGVAICKTKVASRVAARVERGYASGTDLETQGVGEDLMKEWDDFIALIATEPVRVATMLDHEGTAVGGRGIARSHITHNSHGKSVGNDDFDPVFSKDDDL